jgi:hypothetical protein
MRAADLVVDVDVALGRSGRPRRLRARSVLLGDSVHLVVTRDGDLDVRQLAAPEWRRELAQLCRALPEDRSIRRSTGLPDLPWDLVVGAGRAAAEQRLDLYGGIAGRADPHVAEPLRRIHETVIGRLRAVGVAPRRRRVGWVSWVLLPEGWHALTPYVVPEPGGGRRMVRVEPRHPDDLPREVATWAGASR